MSSVIRLAAVAAMASILAACATQPAADLTPPPGRGLDAKTQLESGRR